MNWKKALGWLMVASPFVGIAIFTTVTGGWIITVAIFGSAAIILGVVIGGVTLAMSP